MLKITNCIAVVLLIYLVAWTVSYSLILGFDFRYYFEYLHLAWTNPGENPVFIQIIAVVLTIIVISIALFIRKKQ